MRSDHEERKLDKTLEAIFCAIVGLIPGAILGGIPGALAGAFIGGLIGELLASNSDLQRQADWKRKEEQRRESATNLNASISGCNEARNGLAKTYTGTVPLTSAVNLYLDAVRIDPALTQPEAPTTSSSLPSEPWMRCSKCGNLTSVSAGSTKPCSYCSSSAPLMAAVAPASQSTQVPRKTAKPPVPHQPKSKTNNQVAVNNAHEEMDELLQTMLANQVGNGAADSASHDATAQSNTVIHNSRLRLSIRI